MDKHLVVLKWFTSISIRINKYRINSGEIRISGDVTDDADRRDKTREPGE